MQEKKAWKELVNKSPVRISTKDETWEAGRGDYCKGNVYEVIWPSKIKGGYSETFMTTHKHMDELKEYVLHVFD